MSNGLSAARSAGDRGRAPARANWDAAGARITASDPGPSLGMRPRKLPGSSARRSAVGSAVNDTKNDPPRDTKNDQAPCSVPHPFMAAFEPIDLPSVSVEAIALSLMTSVWLW